MTWGPASRRGLLAALVAAPALAAEDPTLRALVGGTMVALGAHPAVSVLLRNSARGRQQQVYEGLRMPGPPLTLVEDQWLVGWGRDGDRGLFIAFEIQLEQLVLFLLDDGKPVYLSPRTSRWPTPLGPSFGQFSAGLTPD